jgi:hypothetical protein
VSYVLGVIIWKVPEHRSSDRKQNLEDKNISLLKIQQLFQNGDILSLIRAPKTVVTNITSFHPTKRYVISVKTEINTHENNYCTGERECAHGWNNVV